MAYSKYPLDESLHSFERYFQNDASLHMNKKKPNYKVAQKITLYELPQILSYTKLSKPIIEQEKKKMILQKLRIQKQALSAFRQREKINDFFVNYGLNPFLNLEGRTKKQRGKIINGVQLKIKPEEQIAKKKKTAENNLLNILNKQNIPQLPQLPEVFSDLHKKPFQDYIYKNQRYFEDMMKYHQKMSRSAVQGTAKKKGFTFFQKNQVDLSGLLNNVFQIGKHIEGQSKKKKWKEEDFQDKQQKANRQRRKTETSIQYNVKKKAQNPLLKRLPDNEHSFQQILQIQQENFFYQMTPKKPLNIFQIAFEKQSVPLIGKDLLQDNCFEFNSIMQKMKVMKILTYRDISRLARKMILQVKKINENIFDYMDSNDLGFKITQLKFYDVMSVATGRFKPQFVLKIFNEDFEGMNNVNNQKSQTSSQQEDVQINYEQNTQNRGINFYNDNQEHQISIYLKIPATDHQIQAEMEYENIKKQIKGHFQLKQKLLSETITDKSLHDLINRDIKQTTKEFLNVDEPQDKDIDKIVRMNKNKKDKRISLKVNKILEMFEAKKQHQIIKSKAGMIEEDCQIPNQQAKLNQFQQIIQRQQMNIKKYKPSAQKVAQTPKINTNQTFNNKKIQKHTEKAVLNRNSKRSETNNTMCSISPISKAVHHIKNQPLTSRTYHTPVYKNFTATNCQGKIQVSESHSRTPSNLRNSYTPKIIKTTTNLGLNKQNIYNSSFLNTKNSPFFRKAVRKDESSIRTGQNSRKVLPTALFSYNTGRCNYMNTTLKNKL